MSNVEDEWLISYGQKCCIFRVCQYLSKRLFINDVTLFDRLMFREVCDGSSEQIGIFYDLFTGFTGAL